MFEQFQEGFIKLSPVAIHGRGCATSDRVISSLHTRSHKPLRDFLRGPSVLGMLGFGGSPNQPSCAEEVEFWVAGFRAVGSGVLGANVRYVGMLQLVTPPNGTLTNAPTRPACTHQNPKAGSCCIVRFSGPGV